MPIMFLGGPSAALTLVNRTLGTNIGNLTTLGGLAAGFDGVTNQGLNDCAVGGGTSGWIGKTLAAAKIFGRAVIYGSNDEGFTFGNSATINIRGKNGAAPSSRTDGTIIGTTTFTDTGDESAGRTIESTDLISAWDHIFVDIASVSNSIYFAELELYEWA